MTKLSFAFLLPVLLALPAHAEIAALAKDPYWLKLGHWKSNWTGYQSEVDAGAFFLAPNGKTDPEAELRATLAGLRSGKPDVACRYPARAEWLAETLQEPLADLSQCSGLNEWYVEINPHTVSLIFPAAYLNNPASMYGHTLLRIDPPGGESALTSYAINFAAQSTESNGLVFAVKGLTGMYAGVFGVMPYYRKVNEYNDLENRDIWEYPLNLTNAETRRMLLHLWELNETTFDYFFFDENCSYQLLSLLEVARPSLSLTDEYFYQVIPSDTVKQTLRAVGLADKPKFRPALATELAHQVRFFDEDQVGNALAVANGDKSASQLADADSSPEDRARLTEFSYNWLKYRHYREGGTQQVSGPIAFELLRARAGYPAGNLFGEVATPDTAPENGHGSSRAMLAYGQQDDVNFTEFSLRAAYHDHLDPAAGFQAGAAITMFGFSLRDYASGETRLESIDLLEIDSLSPRTAIFQPKSWRLHVRASRFPAIGPGSPLVTDVGGALGASWELADDVLAWAHWNARLLADNHLPKGHFSAVGLDAGILWQANDNSSLLFELNSEAWFGGDELRHHSAEFGSSMRLANDWSLRLTAEYHQLDDVDWHEIQLAAAFYF